MGFEAQLVPTPRGLKPNLCLHPLRDHLDPTEPLEAPLEAATPLSKLGLPAASLEPLIAPLEPEQVSLLEAALEQPEAPLEHEVLKLLSRAKWLTLASLE